MLTPSETRAREARERPIIFSAPMVRAILAGRKTQTRRVLKPQPLARPEWHEPLFGDGESFWAVFAGDRIAHRVRAPYAVGDRLWVRETWQTGSGYAGPQVAYRATGDAHDIDAWDGEDEGAGPSFNYDRLPGLTWHTWLPDLLSGTEGAWRSPIHMPRVLSRLTLKVTEARVERLQDISEADAQAEGVEPYFCAASKLDTYPAGHAACGCDHRAGYWHVWNSIHGKDAWDANPWVAAITFRPLPASLESQKEGAADSASVKERA